MAQRGMTKQKPSKASLRKAGKAMDEAYAAFLNTQMAFAKILNDGGNKDLKSFSAAVKQAALDWHDQGGWIGFSNARIKDIFDRLNRSAH
jgi:hypothetical protein